jgi:FKBP-type peptidyl-prolyl cis-trans isomerase SlyD
MKITNDRLVTMEVRILSADGELLEDADGPDEYCHGNDEILPGLEAALEGAEAGAELEVRLSADEAFGEYDPSGIVSVPRNEFPEGEELSPGDWLEVHVAQDEGAEESEGDVLEMRVVELDDEAVVLDANHLYAGRDLVFEVKVCEVREVPQGASD